jgi:NAD(P)-dependent dehydrogenase (short-subunit alcohol dehydrogenase family)
MGDVRFDGRVAIVTGAGRGLGREHALLLAARGASVVVNDVSTEHAAATVNDIVSGGGAAVADSHSVADPDAARAIVDTALTSFGALHCVVNNAGRGGPTGSFTDTTSHQLDTIIATHLVGTWNVCQAAWPRFVDQSFGRVLITSSAAAIGSLGMPAYSVAKAGLIGLTRSLANEGAPHGITVNCLMPIGYTRSAALNPHEDTRRWMAENFPPSACSPVACWLVHDDIDVSGRIVTAGAGRSSLVTTVGHPGWSGGPDVTLERIRDHWSEVLDTSTGRELLTSRDDLGFFTGPASWRD